MSSTGSERIARRPATPRLPARVRNVHTDPATDDLAGSSCAQSGEVPRARRGTPSPPARRPCRQVARQTVESVVEQKAGGEPATAASGEHPKLARLSRPRASRPPPPGCGSRLTTPNPSTSSSPRTGTRLGSRFNTHGSPTVTDGLARRLQAAAGASARARRAARAAARARAPAKRAKGIPRAGQQHRGEPAELVAVELRRIRCSLQNQLPPIQLEATPRDPGSAPRPAACRSRCRPPSPPRAASSRPRRGTPNRPSTSSSSGSVPWGSGSPPSAASKAVDSTPSVYTARVRSANHEVGTKAERRRRSSRRLSGTRRPPCRNACDHAAMATCADSQPRLVQPPQAAELIRRLVPRFESATLARGWRERTIRPSYNVGPGRDDWVVGACSGPATNTSSERVELPRSHSLALIVNARARRCASVDVSVCLRRGPLFSWSWPTASQSDRRGAICSRGDSTTPRIAGCFSRP